MSLTDERTQRLDALRDAITKAIREHDLYNRHDPEGCGLTRGTSNECATITPALAAYGAAERALGREEGLRDAYAQGLGLLAEATAAVEAVLT